MAPYRLILEKTRARRVFREKVFGKHKKRPGGTHKGQRFGDDNLRRQTDTGESFKLKKTWKPKNSRKESGDKKISAAYEDEISKVKGEADAKIEELRFKLQEIDDARVSKKSQDDEFVSGRAKVNINEFKFKFYDPNTKVTKTTNYVLLFACIAYIATIHGLAIFADLHYSYWLFLCLCYPIVFATAAFAFYRNTQPLKMKVKVLFYQDHDDRGDQRTDYAKRGDLKHLDPKKAKFIMYYTPGKRFYKKWFFSVTRMERKFYWQKTYTKSEPYTGFVSMEMFMQLMNLNATSIGGEYHHVLAKLEHFAATNSSINIDKHDILKHQRLDVDTVAFSFAYYHKVRQELDGLHFLRPQL